MDRLLEQDVTIKGELVKLFNGCPKPSGWFAGKVRTPDGTMNVSGTCSSMVSIGMSLELNGDIVENDYGEQLRAKTITIDTDDIWTMKRYLASSNFPGIGNVIASRIIDKYKGATYNMILSNSAAVQAECKLTDHQMKVLINGLSNNSINNQLERLFPHLGATWIRKIIEEKVYCETPSFAVIKTAITKNPYSLMSVPGMSFKKADEVALKDLKLAWNDNRRVSCVFRRAIVDFMNSTGGTYVNLNDMKDTYKIETFLGNHLGVTVDSTFVKNAMLNEIRLDTCTLEKYQNEVHLYDKKFKNIERDIIRYASMAVACTQYGGRGMYQPIVDMRLQKLKKYIHNQKQSGNWSLCKEQEDAIKAVYENPLLCISGGPGRGKTHVMKNLAQSWVTITKGHVLMLAPTGKAVNRMKESTGWLKAETIARVVYMNIKNDDPDEFIDEMGAPIKCNEDTLIIVDESSMIDFEEGYQLLDLFMGCHVVFVGDANQLPPVEPGSFFKELLRSGVIPIAELQINHRTKSKEISDNADLILAGKSNMQLTNDFQIVPLADAQLVNYVLSEYQSLLSNGADFSDILLMTPLNKGVGGVIDINTRLQEILNPKTTTQSRWLDAKRNCHYEDTKGWEIPHINNSNLKLRIRDRVMNTKNHTGVAWKKYKDNDVSQNWIDKGTGIFNGDTGTIIRFYYGDNKEGEPHVMILLDDNRVVVVNMEEFMEWVPGYCITIHKSQGCEAKHCLIVMPSSLNSPWFASTSFLNRNLLYTAVTRAKDDVEIIGDVNAFKRSVLTEYVFHNTVLAVLLNQAITPYLIQQAINGQD